MRRDFNHQRILFILLHTFTLINVVFASQQQLRSSYSPALFNEISREAQVTQQFLSNARLTQQTSSSGNQNGVMAAGVIGAVVFCLLAGLYCYFRMCKGQSHEEANASMQQNPMHRAIVGSRAR